MRIVDNELQDIDDIDVVDETIKLDENITSIAEYVFLGISTLKRIKIPDQLKEMRTSCFSHCSNLENVILPQGLEKIGNSVFYNTSLMKIIIPNSVTNIGESTFSECKKLEDVELPIDLRCISESLFFNCMSLKNITIPSKVNAINKTAFKNSGLETIVLPDSVNSIGIGAFAGCENLRTIILSKNLKSISRCAFTKCTMLEKIDLPDGLESIEDTAFSDCKSLKEIKIPASVINVGFSPFYQCSSLEKIEMYSDTEICSLGIHDIYVTLINPRAQEKRTVYLDRDGQIISSVYIRSMNKEKNVACIYNDGILYFFDSKDNWVELDLDQMCQYEFSKELGLENCRAMYEWLQKDRFLPHYTVIKTMPIEEIDNFYINNNYKKWGELVKLSQVDLDMDKSAFFGICYILGLFSCKGKISDRAYEFIKKELIPTMDPNKYHVRFGGLKIMPNKFNSEFAELVFKNYSKANNGKDFLVYYNDITYTDYFCNVYNDFYKIKQMYPNRVVNTNRDSDELTPQLCMEVIHSRTYENVNEGNEELAKYIGMCGYSQEEFERAQILFEEGKSIPKGAITLVAKPDDESHLVSYELLEKDNPLGAILGDITNCCQTLNGAGRECVEYGLSKRNSKFMVFRMNNKIIGQSWVWYDKNTHCICLDNIEVPTSVLKNELFDENVKEEFIKCLKRSVDGFLIEMEKRGLNVDSITVGKGYNDIQNLLKSFKTVSKQNLLSDYHGYSDAYNQYVLYKR